MAFIGNTPTTQAFTPAVDFFSGNGSTTAFTLSRPVASVAQVQAVIANVPQNPSTAFTVNGNTVTFTSAPPTGTNNIYVYYTSPITQVSALPQDPQVFGNLQFSSMGARITGDFSNGTFANRVSFQSSVANGVTGIQAVPNGTNQTATFDVYNAADPTNASFGQLQINATDVRVVSNIRGTGTYLPMTFYTGGSERVRVDTSGNVGIGTNAPADILDIQTPSSNYSMRLRASANNFALIKFVNNANNNQDAAFGTPGANTLAVYTNGFNERMRIDGSGRLLVNLTATIPAENGMFQVDGGSFTAMGVKGGSNNYFVSFYNTSNSLIGSITGSTGTSTAYNTSSDYRLKENIQPMQNALATVAQLNPVTYNWKSDGSDGQGFIAHELKAVVPDCVTGEKDAVDADGNPVYQGVDTSFLVATLTKAIQEQQAIITDLKARIETLEAK